MDRRAVLGDAAGHHYRALFANPADQAQRAVGDCHMDRAKHIGLGMALGTQRNDLGFGKGRAQAGNPEFVFGRHRGVAHVLKFDFHCASEHFEEFSGAGSAAVIHRELRDKAVGINRDDLAVLPADVDHQPRIGHHRHRTARMAGDLGKILVGDVEHPAAVTGADRAAHVGLGQSGLLKHAFDRGLDREVADRTHVGNA